MNLRHLILIAVACLVVMPGRADINDELNKQAESEYLKPVRPGSSDGSVPFWNGFAWKFLYAPSFDFKTVKGAKSYRFTAVSDSTKTYSFTADTPTADLSPIWNQIAPSDVELTVEALDKNGKVIKVVGKKEFERGFPFHAPYRDKVYSYDECIRRALSFVHHMPAVEHWQYNKFPDMTHPYNSYLCKIIGNTIQTEIMYAEYFPEEKEAVLKRCRNIASFIMSQAQPADAVLAYFPPTYYGKNLAAGAPQNQGKTMVMDATEVAYSFLDLYKACGDRQYLDFTLHIIDTYKKIRRADGSFPVKVDIETGESVNKANVIPFQLFMVLNRLEKEFNIYDYKEFRESIEKWTADVVLKSFDWNSPFEDIPLENYKPYQNPTCCTAAPVAIYLMRKDNPTKEELKIAEELARFCEDQFVLWGSTYTNGIPDVNYPCACEQIDWDEPTDASTANVLTCFTLLYKHTGDKLWLAKANALAANLTFMQNKVSGMLPTVGWRNSDHILGQAAQFWINCTVGSVASLRDLQKNTNQK